MPPAAPAAAPPPSRALGRRLRSRRRSRACRRRASPRRCRTRPTERRSRASTAACRRRRFPQVVTLDQAIAIGFATLAAARIKRARPSRSISAPVDLAKTAILPNISGTARRAQHSVTRDRRVPGPAARPAARASPSSSVARRSAVDLRRRQGRRAVARSESDRERGDRDLQAPIANGRLQRRERVLRGARRAAHDAGRDRDRQLNQVNADLVSAQIAAGTDRAFRSV